MIDPQRVEEIIVDCLNGEEEGALIVEGVLNRYALNEEKLNEYRQEVYDMLSELPEPFMRTKGGGWSFLQACDDKDGNQWTDLHWRMEQLFALGQGLGVVTYPFGRDMWNILPGGMPYAIIDDTKMGETE